jgi:integrase
MQPGELIWDAKVAGFGARRQKGPAVSYLVFYRTKDGRQRWQTIGRHGSPWTPDSARAMAKRLLAEVAAGSDPAGNAKAAKVARTVGELLDTYLEEAEKGKLLTKHGTSKKSSTIGTDRSRIERHIRPFFGPIKVAAVTRSDVERFMHAVADGDTARSAKRDHPSVRGGRGAATRTVGLLGAIFTFAVRKGMRPDNPAVGVVRFADGQRLRRLSDDEYRVLGDALRAARRDVWPAALAAIQFLALTGWRTGEAISLRWKDVDLGRRTAQLADTKTGRSMRPLSLAACDVLKSLPRGGDLVFPATRGTGPMIGFRKIFDRVARAGSLSGDITPHVLRHSFASLAADMGYSELAIGSLVGHKGRSMTSRYVHSADAALLAAADAIAVRTQAQMGDEVRSGQVVRLIAKEA